MHITYTPENPADGDRQEWDFDPKKLRHSQASIIQKKTPGRTFAEFTNGIQAEDMDFLRVLLWYLLAQAHPQLQLRDVPDFVIGELRIEYSVAELNERRDTVAAMPGLSDMQRGAILSTVDKELAKAHDREGTAYEGEVLDPTLGKALTSKTSEDSPTSTG